MTGVQTCALPIFGILTFHRVLNEGALLQTICLFRLLKDAFPECCVEVIDYMTFKNFLSLTKTRFNIFKFSELPARNRKYKHFFRCLENNITLSKERYITNDCCKIARKLTKKYDVLVTGSDEIWKIYDGKDSLPFPNIFWLGKDLEYSKKIAYAVSANRTNLSMLQIDQIAQIKDCLNEYDLIGYRDEATKSLVDISNIREDKLFKTPDPTFAVDLPYLNLKDKLLKYGIDFSKPLIGIMLQDEEISRKVYSFYEKSGYLIVGLSFRNRYVDVDLSDKLNPLEWAGVINLLSRCITGRFHGVIFCMKNLIPFYCLDECYYENSRSKILDLLKDVGLQGFYMNMYKKGLSDNEIISIEEAMKSLDVEKVSYGLHSMRNKSKIFMKKIRKVVFS